MQKPFLFPASRLSWLWALPPLLLATALTVPLLDVDAFNGDEPVSLIAAGIIRSGPLSLVDAWSSVSPQQALGWPTLLAIWGRLVGWSELAVRALPLFFGMLALAWVYRTGRDLLAPRAGLFAAMLLGASVFFLAYMIHARAFTLVVLCTALSIWSYWRVALHPRPPGRGAQAGLLLGSIGLLYVHYYCALFLPALGLFHLFLVPKNRRWWQPVFLLVLAALLAMLQLPGFLQGLDKTVSNEALHNKALSATALISRFVRSLTNGLVDPSPPFSELLLFALLLALVIVTLWFLRSGKRAGAIWLLVFASTTLLSLVIAINEMFKIIGPTRIRYLMPLWPLVALLVAAALWRLARRYRRLVAVLLALWLFLGAWLTVATDFRYELGFFFSGNYHRMHRVMQERLAETDFIVFDKLAVRENRDYFYFKMLGLPMEIVSRHWDDPYQNVRPVHVAYPYLSFLYPSEDRMGYADLPQALGRVLCERDLDEWGFTLERYALHSVENCPDRAVRLAFDSDIQLTAPEITLLDGLLRLDAHFRSADETLLARYSLAVHVFEAESGERVAQGDVGVGPGAIVPLRSEIDVSALPPGDYEVRVALYDWQTGVRLPARDTETNEVGDMHTLHHFRLG